MYLSMNRDTGAAITYTEHIHQSVHDTLITSEGSRIGCCEYGSLLSVLIDQL